MFANHYQFLVLVKYFHQFCYQPISRLLVIAFGFDGHGYGNGIANKNRAGKTEPLIAIGNGDLIDHLRGEADGYGKDEGAVSDPFLKGLCFAPFFIHMVGEKITGLTGM